MSLVNPNDPWYPTQSDLHGQPYKGADIRTEIASRNMAAILGGIWGNQNTKQVRPDESIARWATQAADALIAELNKSNDPDDLKDVRFGQ